MISIYLSIYLSNPVNIYHVDMHTAISLYKSNHEQQNEIIEATKIYKTFFLSKNKKSWPSFQNKNKKEHTQKLEIPTPHHAQKMRIKQPQTPHPNKPNPPPKKKKQKTKNKTKPQINVNWKNWHAEMEVIYLSGTAFFLKRTAKTK